ncbi:MAG: FAD-binding protein [Clostridiales bacterium GWB2_37_7]|nr:MAG: FAD-binding protein [Clostridiales bacterium GWB2_37_7]
MKIKEYIKPVSIAEAYELCSKGAVAIGGGAFLNLGERVIDQAVDLSGLDLDYIQERDSHIEIGAMATLREIETSSILKENFDGVLSKTAASIMGVQVRNISTIGGSIYGKFGFSDIITILLALDAKVELYHACCMDLESYLNSDMDKDIILKIIIKKNVSHAAFESVRKTETDFSILNAAAALVDGHLRLSIGARPGKAKLARGAIGFLDIVEASEAGTTLAVLASEELQFGSDIRGSEEYRRNLCKTLVKKCVQEVLQ